jgi:serine/threonine protein kinase
MKGTVRSERISHYRILNKLGAGGMGEVYLGEDARLDRYAAIKKSLLLPAIVPPQHEKEMKPCAPY